VLFEKDWICEIVEEELEDGFVDIGTRLGMPSALADERPNTILYATYPVVSQRRPIPLAMIRICCRAETAMV
jgi:hypothetical protein